MRYFLGLVFWAALTLSAHGQELWGKSFYGMTAAQVQQSVDGVQEVVDGQTLATGAKELLRVPSVEIAGKKFNALFYFKSEKLDQVTLSLDRKDSFTSVVLTLESVAQALRSKYGREISHKSQRGTLNLEDFVWMNGGTNISVFAVSVGENDALLNINYQVRIAKDASNL